jgi:hypothetical protein
MPGGTKHNILRTWLAAIGRPRVEFYSWSVSRNWTFLVVLALILPIMIRFLLPIHEAAINVSARVIDPTSARVEGEALETLRALKTSPQGMPAESVIEASSGPRGLAQFVVRQKGPAHYLFTTEYVGN